HVNYGIFLPCYLIFFFFCFSTLPGLLQSMDLSTLKCFPPGQPEKFSAFLDKVVGLQK
uniref:N-acetylglucosaminyldiphosphodolichol N-acetylglucosaminyltransferase n=1 Tax=Equus asinus asinus TaxID=83772 RepID=A0A8C4ML05_EQUAS